MLDAAHAWRAVSAQSQGTSRPAASPAYIPVYATDIIRTGSDGRLRYSPDQRQALLDAFDRGGQSALAFSKHHGVCYQTFIAWLTTAKSKSTTTSSKTASGPPRWERGTGCSSAAKHRPARRDHLHHGRVRQTPRPRPRGLAGRRARTPAGDDQPGRSRCAAAVPLATRRRAGRPHGRGLPGLKRRSSSATYTPVYATDAPEARSARRPSVERLPSFQPPAACWNPLSTFIPIAGKGTGLHYSGPLFVGIPALVSSSHS